MTSQQRSLIMPLLLSLANARTMDQVSVLWSALRSACGSAGVVIGNMPTSLPQAKSVANSLRQRLGG